MDAMEEKVESIVWGGEEMLINKIMNYCDLEYTKEHTDSRCENCQHVGACSGGCKRCLEEIHYPLKYPKGKKSYDCPNLINFYVCDYTFKYATEIYYLLQKSAALKRITQYNVFSIGCGACPDLMAFEAYILKNKSGKTVQYMGIYKNPLWKPVHEQVEQYTTDVITCTNLEIEDVFDFLDKIAVADINVLVLQYVISSLYASEWENAIHKLFDLIIENVVKYRNKKEPFVIIINDVNSNNTGRELFLDLISKLRRAGIHGHCEQYYFDRNIKNKAQIYGTKHQSSTAMTPALVQKYGKYEPWQFCTSAQLLIEIGW